MRILVTGAAGFIGSHLCERLLKSDHQVMGIDNFDSFYKREIKEANLEDVKRAGDFEFKEMDILDKDGVDELWRARGPFDVVVHLAALAGVRPSLEAPMRYAKVNVEGTMVILEHLRKHPDTRLVFASSSSVYGARSEVPFDEADPCNHPVSPYASTKRSGELLAWTYHHLYGIDAVCLRFFTVYGPRQRPEMAIAKFVRMVAEGEPITLFGDGSSARDYTFVEDIIDGTQAAVEQDLSGYGIYNLGGSGTISLMELVGSIEKAVGRPAKKNFDTNQPGDVPITCARVDRAARDLGYKPKVKLEEGLRRYVSWAAKMKRIKV